jgi:hypothetical protein
MFKLILMTTGAMATMAAAPAPSSQTASAAAQPGAAASQQMSDGGTTTPPGSAVGEKKICKLLPSSGTRMAKRACLTPKEWKQVEEDVGYDI